MDLRRRLLGWLGLLLGGLLAMALSVQLWSLHDDIENEIAASSRLVELLLAADAGAPDLAERLAEARLRHLHIGLDDRPAPAADGGLPGWLGLAGESAPARQLRIGERTLSIAANPHSEIEERLGDTVRLLITLLLYSGATLLAAWWATDRALRPVRELEAGLQRLAGGDDDPALPDFALREFRRVAGAIDRLAASLGEANAARKALARQLISLQEDERRALARELHDEMGQTLAALNATAAHLERHAPRLTADALAECGADLRRDIRTIGEQLRALLKSLRPHGLNADSLPALLRELVDHWRARATGIDFAIEMPAALPGLDETAALTLYRVVQEALTNVVRHSRASRCSVRIVAVDGEIRAEIVDDGEGLKQAAPTRHGGLLGMAERLEMAGGRLAVATPEGGGLRLTAQLPGQQGGNVQQGEN